MADNITTPVPAGTILAGDLIAGVLYPRSKVVFGLDGTATDVSGTDPLPVTSATLATQATLAALSAKLPASVGPKTDVTSLSVVPSTDQDPIFDHVNGVKANITTTSSTAITPAAGTKYIRVHATADCFVRTDGTAAADAGGSIKLIANQPETIPVVAGTAVTAIVTTGTATLYATPMKVR